MRIALFLIATFVPIAVFCQDFLHDKPSQYKGTILTVLPRTKSLQEFGYRGFIKNYSLSAYDAKNIVEKDKDAYASKYKSLVGRQFKVTNVITKGTETYLELQNDTLKTIYYLYNNKYKIDFLFSVEGLKIDTALYCTEIKKNIDKFNKTERYYSPLGKLSIWKVVLSSGKITYYISLTTTVASPFVGNGWQIMLSNNTIINFQEKINIDVADDASFEAKVFSQLTNEQMKMLTEFAITDFKLVPNQMVKSIEDGWIYKIYATCLFEK